MARKNVKFPVAAEIKATGEICRATGKVSVAGIQCFALVTRRGKTIGTFAEHAVILHPSRGLDDD